MTKRTSRTILRITGAVVALALIGFAAWFWQLEDGQTQAVGLISTGLGLIALVLRNPLQREPRDGGGGTAAVVCLAVMVSTAPTLIGCGGAEQQHRTLNWVTRVADPTYEMVVDACDDMRDYVVEREGFTEAEDDELMGQVNGVCDRAVSSFELLRHTQLSARAAVEEGVPGVTEDLIGRALDVWRELQELVGDIEALEAQTAGGEA